MLFLVVDKKNPISNPKVLNTTVTPTTIVESRAVLLLSDGNVVEVDGVSPVTLNSPSGNYYVAIRHRNHLGVMTNAAIFFGLGNRSCIASKLKQLLK